MATIHDSNEKPQRLVKVYLPVETVRRMDAAILRSDGAYFDRAEFVNEALVDRLAEENHRTVEDVPAPEKRPSRTKATTRAAEFAPETAEAVGMFGDWLSNGAAPTLPALAGPEANFGLHNRDYPTIWACDVLGRLTVDAGAPIAWDVFSQELLQRSWSVGRRLAADDAESGRTLKAGVGFPTNAAKREAAERRFLAHGFGLPTSRGNPGPVFVFKWVGVEESNGKTRVALTQEAIDILRALAATGDPGPPFGLESWRIFADHLAEHARPELEAWLSVLALVRDGLNRTELVERCTWWSGNEAATNAMSYISRGREWGLVEPRLDPDNHYALTERGDEELDRLSGLVYKEGAR